MLGGVPVGLLEDDGLADELEVDWRWLAAGPGVTGTPGWPVVRVDGDHSVGAGDSGRGTLVVTGLNLTLPGGFVAETEVRGGPSIHLHTGCVAAASRAFAHLSVREGSWGEPR